MNNNIKEEWRSISGYEGLYEISNLGNVKSLNFNGTKKSKLMKPTVHSNGYLYVNLYKEGKKKMCRVHRLVAQAFIQNPEAKEQVNHRDGVKTNNCVDNLEWCNNSENVRHAYRTGLIKGNRGKNNVRWRGYVQQIDLKTGNVIKIFETIYEIEKELGFHEGHISKVCNGIRNSAYGFRWKYAK